MNYCVISQQIAQHAHDCDEIRCSECDSESVEVERNKNYWSKKCLDCGFSEDNDPY
jgi:predicted nucleic-acid-binding Zn-ribbon protein